MACLAGILTTVVLPVLLIPLAAFFFETVTLSFHPAEGEIWGYNSNARGAYALWSLLGLSAAAGIFVATLIIDPTFGLRAESIIVLVLFVLMMRSGQAALDVVLAVFGLATVMILWRWRPRRITLAAFRSVAVFLVMMFGFLMPLMFLVIFLFDRFGVQVFEESVAEGWAEFAAGLISLVTAIIAFARIDRDKTAT